MTTPVRQQRDEGFSLLELIISMGIFMVVLAVFIAGMLTMTKDTVRSQDVSDASDSTRLAFQTMDKQIRYASSINFPGVGSSGSQYVEFITTAQPDGLAPMCTQWRYDPTAHTLAYRTWRDLPTGTVSSWRQVAAEVQNAMSGPTAKPPFALQAAGGTYLRQQLTVTVQAGGTGRGIAAETATVFVARNSSGSSPSNDDLNGDHQSDTLICSSHLGRP